MPLWIGSYTKAICLLSAETPHYCVSYIAVIDGPSRPLINPLLAQFEAVSFSLFLGLKNTCVGPFDFSPVQVAIRNGFP